MLQSVDSRVGESHALVLSSAKAHAQLGWRCVWDLETAVAASVAWYRAAYTGAADLRAMSERQIGENAERAAREAS